MAEVPDEQFAEELTEDQLDELEALGAAEDAEQILGPVAGQNAAEQNAAGQKDA
ncbi:hypothetical protein PWY87_34815 [Kribbella solani]|uniref:hypothetical protein n=1 Tax=Kribbella solani TaxID=236067 RepID=UPI0029AF10F1|nr:hypothetical protein [Kribbella solani]MDX2972452.1 hypothetical protein [Kribbella solani]MDX3006890.1 hypothetical protein [Kribbella solani]